MRDEEGESGDGGRCRYTVGKYNYTMELFMQWLYCVLNSHCVLLHNLHACSLCNNIHNLNSSC